MTSSSSLSASCRSCSFSSLSRMAAIFLSFKLLPVSAWFCRKKNIKFSEPRITPEDKWNLINKSCKLPASAFIFSGLDGSPWMTAMWHYCIMNRQGLRSILLDKHYISFNRIIQASVKNRQYQTTPSTVHIKWNKKISYANLAFRSIYKSTFTNMCVYMNAHTCTCAWN